MVFIMITGHRVWFGNSKNLNVGHDCEANSGLSGIQIYHPFWLLNIFFKYSNIQNSTVG